MTPLAGDTTRQVMWRLENGELPAVKAPAVVAIIAGANDIGSAFFANPDAGEAPLLQEVEPTAQRYGVSLGRANRQPVPGQRMRRLMSSQRSSHC